jgi:hypothetical protein
MAPSEKMHNIGPSAPASAASKVRNTKVSRLNSGAKKASLPPPLLAWLSGYLSRSPEPILIR